MTRTYIRRELRQRAITAARGRCGYCLTQETITGTPLGFEHIIPQSCGGPTTEDNLWLSCAQCNMRKNDRVTAHDPATGDRALLFNPRRQTWNEHCAWSEGATIVAGLTAIGRAAVAALDLNRRLLVDARRLWVTGGWHPPED